MSIRGRRRLARRFGPRLERILHTEPDPANLCAGSGAQAFWAKARTGECPVCFGTHKLDHDDRGGATLAPHERTNP